VLLLELENARHASFVRTSNVGAVLGGSPSQPILKLQRGTVGVTDASK